MTCRTYLDESKRMNVHSPHWEGGHVHGTAAAVESVEDDDGGSVVRRLLFVAHHDPIEAQLTAVVGVQRIPNPVAIAEEEGWFTRLAILTNGGEEEEEAYGPSVMGVGKASEVGAGNGGGVRGVEEEAVHVGSE
jgi:hypothetical protein